MDAGTLRIILLVIGIGFLVALFFWERHRAARVHDERPISSHARHQAHPQAQAKSKREPRFSVTDEDDWQPGQEMPDWSRVDSHEADALPTDASAENTSASDASWNELGDEFGVEHRNAQRDDHWGDEWHDRYEERPTGDIDAADIAGIVTDTDEGPIIQIFVVALDGVLSGRDILAAASRHFLIAGRKDIFHRVDGDPSQARTLFSMANLVQPGNFPLYPNPAEGMADFETRGIALFTQMRGEYQDLEALDAMLNTAKSLARELSAEVEDAQHRPISVKRIESLRNAVIAYTDPACVPGQNAQATR